MDREGQLGAVPRLVSRAQEEEEVSCLVSRAQHWAGREEEGARGKGDEVALIKGILIEASHWRVCIIGLPHLVSFLLGKQ